MRFFNSKKDIGVYKEGSHIFTSADIIASKIIVEGLRKEFPHHAILCEEEKDEEKRLKNRYVWVVDPLDGTKEFLKRRKEFTINIALVEGRVPILGVVFAPALDRLYYAVRKKGAYLIKGEKKKQIKASTTNRLEGIRMALSRSHATPEEERVSTFLKARVARAGSSLKGCLVAEGKADIYLRVGATNEWDICAMQLIIEESGGRMTDLKGKPLKYNKKNTLVPGFLASNGKNHNKILKLVQKAQRGED